MRFGSGDGNPDQEDFKKVFGNSVRAQPEIGSVRRRAEASLRLSNGLRMDFFPADFGSGLK